MSANTAQHNIHIHARECAIYYVSMNVGFSVCVCESRLCVVCRYVVFVCALSHYVKIGSLKIVQKDDNGFGFIIKIG